MKTDTIPTLFEQDLQKLINRYSMENGSNTPDFILARFLDRSLKAFDEAVTGRTKWYSTATLPTEPPVEHSTCLHCGRPINNDTSTRFWVHDDTEMCDCTYYFKDKRAEPGPTPPTPPPVAKVICKHCKKEISDQGGMYYHTPNFFIYCDPDRPTTMAEPDITVGQPTVETPTSPRSPLNPRDLALPAQSQVMAKCWHCGMDITRSEHGWTHSGGKLCAGRFTSAQPAT